MLLHSHCLSGHPVQSQETMVSFPVTVRDISQTDQGLSSDDWFMLSRSSNCVFFLGGGSLVCFCSFLGDVDGKVIHLVERAPPQTTQYGSGGGGVSSGGAEGGPSTTHSSTSPQGGPHDRNGNSYVMLGTFNLPVNIMDPQQIQVKHHV